MCCHTHSVFRRFVRIAIWRWEYLFNMAKMFINLRCSIFSISVGRKHIVACCAVHHRQSRMRPKSVINARTPNFLLWQETQIVSYFIVRVIPNCFETASFVILILLKLTLRKRKTLYHHNIKVCYAKQINEANQWQEKYLTNSSCSHPIESNGCTQSRSSWLFSTKNVRQIKSLSLVRMHFVWFA